MNDRDALIKEYAKLACIAYPISRATIEHSMSECPFSDEELITQIHYLKQNARVRQALMVEQPTASPMVAGRRK